MKIRYAALFLLTILLTACGGGGTSTGGTVQSPGSTVISGTASLGIIKDGRVKVYQLTSDGRKLFLAETRTDAYGRYSVSITTPTTPVLVEVSGGSYTDEATGLSVVRSDSEVLHAVVGSPGTIQPIAVTPLTELAYQLAGSPLTAAAIDSANSKVSDAFNVDIVTVQPVDPSLTGFRSPTTQAQKDYSLALATLSQQAQSTPGGSVGTVVEGYRQDLAADDRISLGTATTFSTTLSQFLANPRNQTGLTTATTALANFGTLTQLVKLNTTGTFAAGSFIKGVQVQLQLPAGVNIQYTGVTPDAGVVMPSGAAAAVTTIESYYDPATKTISLGIINAQPGFGLGEFVTIRTDVAPGAPLDESLFTVSGGMVTGQGGLQIDPNSISIFVTI